MLAWKAPRTKPESPFHVGERVAHRALGTAYTVQRVNENEYALQTPAKDQPVFTVEKEKALHWYVRRTW